MKKIVLFIMITVIATALLGNGFSLNSIGPKGAGLGGAFVGQADDATAVYWNPAGLTDQDASVNFSIADVYMAPTYKNEGLGIDAEGADVNHLSPHLFMNYTQDKFSWGFGLYVPHGLGSEWYGEDFTALAGPAELAPGLANPFAGKEFDWYAKIVMLSVSSSAGYKVTDKFSVGMTVNINHGYMEIERGEDRISLTATPGTPTLGEDGMIDTQYREDVEGSGTSFGFGIQYDVCEKLTLGLSYHSPSVVALKGDATLEFASGDEDLYVRRDLEIPMWVAFGSSFRATDKWKFNFDVHFTKWATFDKMVTQVVMDSGTENILTHMDWEDCFQYRFGTEYLATENLALRAGYFYDPAPAPDETLNILFPSSENHNLAGGFGYTLGSVTLDFTAEYYFGQERDVEQAEHNMGGIHQMDIFAYLVGLKYNF